jgi:Flp pilus assembly protein TadG
MRRDSRIRQHPRFCAFRSADCRGSVAAEFAAVAPIILLVTAAIVDLGSLAKQSAALAGATRIGAEYARFHPADTTGIKDAMQNSMNFSPPLSFPASFGQSCECDDQTAIACAESCATAGRPGPNRVFMLITASQVAGPLVAWPSLPQALSSTTEIRLQ